MYLELLTSKELWLQGQPAAQVRTFNLAEKPDPRRVRFSGRMTGLEDLSPTASFSGTVMGSLRRKAPRRG
jgi:hypothetical protein